MKELLSKFFYEMGLYLNAKAILQSDHKFSVKIYGDIFLKEIESEDRIVSAERAQEMREEFRNALRKEEI